MQRHIFCIAVYVMVEAGDVLGQCIDGETDSRSTGGMMIVTICETVSRHLVYTHC